MTYGELTRRLRRLGVRYERHGRGSHEIWVNPASRSVALIPNHGSRELATGTVRSILKQLGLTEDDLRNA